MIPVTKSYLPPINEYTAQVNRAFENEWITNRGQLIRELEEKLKVYLEIDNILITNNGTIPLQIALKLLGNQGEIITTPFSYVATTAAIVWENCTPIFVDINPNTFTIDTSLIEAAITPKTTCILATHVFGNVCDIEEIDRIAKKHNLKVIYDAAHCFGVKYNGKSIFEYGDISTCSFHATKLFHTGEGGAIFCKDEALRHKIFYSHNFGHNGPLDFYGLGINGKNSELHAAMGLAIFPYIEMIISKRKEVIHYYLESLDFTKVKAMELNPSITWNYSYFPIVFENEASLLKTLETLNKSEIFPRRYFYPSLNTIKYTQGASMPISENLASRIMCLPLYVGLKQNEIAEIVKLINA
ncbi:MAG: DegT/DnrJ/EryC1/StrS family aminotransferase [Flavobacteriales bacterium]|nr:DegT/DnrJ/EryC1/StrS family aminotransferase [Flavobacteriales bacterium]